jgi:hypothetical protein
MKGTSQFTLFNGASGLIAFFVYLRDRSLNYGGAHNIVRAAPKY